MDMANIPRLRLSRLAHQSSVTLDDWSLGINWLVVKVYLLLSYRQGQIFGRISSLRLLLLSEWRAEQDLIIWRFIYSPYFCLEWIQIKCASWRFQSTTILFRW